MKKLIVFASLLIFVNFVYAQKIAYVDTEYILSNIPAYEAAQKELDKKAKEWEQEIENDLLEVENLYRKFQTDQIILSDEMKRKKEEEIINKEKEVRNKKKKYFGREGELYKKRQELIKPIQDEVYKAINEIRVEGNYAFIFDISENPFILSSDPKYDKSDDVLEKLGYRVD